VPFILDRARMPLVQLRTWGTGTDEELERNMATLDEMLALRQRHALLFDATGGERPPASQRHRIAEWIKERSPEIGAYTAAVAFVFTNALVRGALTAILWISPLPAPHRVFARHEDAERWLVALLTEEKLAVPGLSDSR